VLNPQLCNAKAPEDYALLSYSNVSTQLDDVKHTILKCIYENPGIRYREILKLTGISNGVLEYHLKILEGSYKIINVDRHKSKTTRYYPLYFEPSNESEVLCHIRNDTTVKRIILFILDHSLCTFNQIVQYTKKAPSTISWHLKKLKQSGMIMCIRYGRRNYKYKITNDELISQVLHKREKTSMNSATYSYSASEGICNSI
jgi:predicted transcriptional regulator